MALLDSWVHRKRWEAKLNAVTLLNMLGEAMTTKPKGGQAGLMQLAQMGFGIRGHNTG